MRFYSLIYLAESLKNEPSIHFLFVGEGTEVPRLKNLIRQKGITNISIHSVVDQQTYLGMLSEFDIGLITLDSRLKTHNFPGKLLAYIYSSIPILASVNPGNDLMNILTENHAGLVSINGQHEQLKIHALQLSRDSQLRHKLGNNGRLLLENMFSVSQAAKQILSHFSDNH